VTVTSRPATRADIPVLVALTRRCDESHRAWVGPDLVLPARDAAALEWDIRFARSGAWITLAQDDDDAILGVVAYAAAQISRRDRTVLPGLAHISAVFVDPACWRRGIARRLLDEAEQAMRTEGYERAQLWTLEGSPAEQLYAVLGWTRDDRRDIFTPMNLPTVAYNKVL
jgi:GNAT superfamily N-acetyltransferase